MPELPEVEAAKRLVDSHCLGGVIVKAVVADDNKVFDGVTPSALQEALTGKKILSAHRKGKHMWLQLDSPPWPSFQFGMSGAIIVKGVKGPQYKSSKISDTEEFPSAYSKVHLQLDSGVEVAFTDKRRFARIRLLDDPTKAPPISELGLDAFLELPSAEQLVEAIKNKKGSVKALLLDQSFLAGVGNWVGDEVLYQSKIHPEQPANSLKEEECIRLHTAIREVLDLAVSVDADSEQFPRTWLFHQRWGKKPGLIDGNQIETISISGRTSAYVPNVQKYSGPELKGARTRAAVEEEMPHDGEALGEPDADEIVDGAADEAVVEKEVSPDKAGTSELKRGRGRPPKNKGDTPVKSAPPTPPGEAATDNASPAGAKKRGRPPKLKTASSPNEGKTNAEEGEKESPSEPKRRGRPPKAKADASKEAVSKALEEAPGKGDEKASGDDKPAGEGEDMEEAPKDQVDAAAEKKEGLASPITPKRRGRPPKAKPEPTEELEIMKKAKVGKDEEGGASPAGSAEPKRRGRPPKAKPEPEGKPETEAKDLDSKEEEGPPQAAEGAAATTTPTPKKRGRPPKAKPVS